MGPVTKGAAQANKLAEKQSGSLGRLKVSAMEALRIAEKMHASRPDGDTAALILAQRTSEKEIIALTGTNEELRLTISGMEVSIAQAQDKISAEIAGSQAWRTWAWRWWWAFSGTVAGIAALVYFRQSIPLLKFF